MDSMSRTFRVNEQTYFLRCWVNQAKKKIYIEVDKKKGKYGSDSEEFYYSKMREFKFLNIFKLTVERRLEWKIQKIIKRITKDANKSNGLQGAIKHIDDIYNLDKHMDV